MQVRATCSLQICNVDFFVSSICFPWNYHGSGIVIEQLWFHSVDFLFVVCVLVRYLCECSGDCGHQRHRRQRIFRVCWSSDSQGDVPHSCPDLQGAACPAYANTEQHQSKLCTLYIAKPR